MDMGDSHVGTWQGAGRCDAHVQKVKGVLCEILRWLNHTQYGHVVRVQVANSLSVMV